MAKKKPVTEDEMTIMDAVDNLSSMAELDIEVEKEVAVPKGVKADLHSLSKMKPEDKQKTLETVKGTFKTVHKYLKHVYQKDKEQLQDVEVQRGVKAIMVLAGEAAEKIDKCTSLFKHTYKEGHIEEIKEYKELKHFYLSKIVKRFQEVLAHEEAWEEEWGAEDVYLNIEKLGLKDLETVKRDREYELFYIRQDDGKPFFNRNLLRHIKLVSDFDEVVSEVEGEDPLLKINSILDREAQAMAEDIKLELEEALGDFYVDAMQNKDIPIINDANKVVMALLLAANPRNLLQNTLGKTCTRYFHDFHEFLREILASAEYIRLISHSLDENDRLSRVLIGLIHACCHAFMTRMGKQPYWKEFIQDLIKKGYKGHPPPLKETSDTLSLFSDLLDNHDIITSVLKKYPSGPLFKTLDIFREREEKEGFDPLFQGNLPELQYAFSSQSFDSKCLRLPCPTYHEQINKAKVVDEFSGYLRFLEAKKSPTKYLMINLQDRTSWEEHARCQALEELQKRADYSGQFVLVTLPKKSDFYYQADAYLEVEDAKSFLKLIEEQISSGEECGFFFSHSIDKKELMDFVKQVLPIIHQNFFEGKKVLSRKDRLDYIELFYLFLSLKVLDLTKPDYFSFTCKDAVDVGQTMAGAFYTMIKLFSQSQKWSREEQDSLMWLLYGPALKIRERLVDYQRFNRMISALSCFAMAVEKDQKKVLKGFEPLYDYPLFQKMKVT